MEVPERNSRHSYLNNKKVIFFFFYLYNSRAEQDLPGGVANSGRGGGGGKIIKVGEYTCKYCVHMYVNG
jgi:hypothetical protein